MSRALVRPEDNVSRGPPPPESSFHQCLGDGRTLFAHHKGENGQRRHGNLQIFIHHLLLMAHADALAFLQGPYLWHYPC